MRPVFLHDDESKTQEQLNNFVRREMSLAVRKSLTAEYTVEGHGQKNEDDGGFVPWDIDTVVDVLDDVAGIAERMYVVGRGFEKSRQSGTTTRLELIRLHSIELGDVADSETAKPKAGPNTFPKTTADADLLNRALANTTAALKGKGPPTDPITLAPRKR